MTTPRAPWGWAGVIAGLAGLAASHAATMALTVHSSPLIAVAEMVIEYTPGKVADWAIDILGPLDKPVLMLIVVSALLLCLLWAGRAAARSWWRPVVVWLLLGGVGLVAVLTRHSADAVDILPVVLGVVTGIVTLSFLTDPLRREVLATETPVDVRHTRRGFLIRAGVAGAGAIAVGLAGDLMGRGRRHVEQTRRLLNLSVTDPLPPASVRVDVEGVSRWKTPNSDFYLIDTTILPPAIEPKEWRLRIHGMVERELVLSYQDLLDRELTEQWITLNCVSNEVGGPLIGNAWWSGVLVAPLLAEAGVKPGANAVLQTSHDGWSCGTPLSALTDGRTAMLAFAMNGDPLPIEHGFPVRMIVPGLYGYVSACKWIVDMEVSTFDKVDGFWIDKGWAEKAPVKISSRIDVPSSGDEVPAGRVRAGGLAWSQHIGIEAVEYALDGQDWKRAELAGVPNEDTWVQWAATLEVEEGDHTLLVRAIGKDGEVQTGIERDVRPDGATGHHEVEFSASA